MITGERWIDVLLSVNYGIREEAKGILRILSVGECCGGVVERQQSGGGTRNAS